MPFRLLIARTLCALSCVLMAARAVAAPVALAAHDPEILVDFDSGCPCPDGGFVKGSDGLQYGTGLSVAGRFSIVFRVLADGSVDVLHEFSSLEGSTPRALVLGVDGNFYGVTRHGGEFGLGTIYRIRPEGKFKLLHAFNDAEGRVPSQLRMTKHGRSF